jgi:tripartite-type tricarboxylate transporter receptor subunit TctC
MHLAMESIKLSAGVDILHVPFKGGAQAYPELMAGRIDLYLDPTFGLERFVKSGKVKAIAVTSARPDPSAPGVAPVSQTIPGFEVLSINGVAAPKATPRDLVHRISADFAKLLKAPDVVQKLAELGLEPVGNTPEEFDAYIKTEIERWTAVTRKANIKFE